MWVLVAFWKTIDLGSSATLSNLPAAGELIQMARHIALAVGHVVQVVVVVGAEETCRLAVVPAADVYGADVLGDLAGDGDAIGVVDADAVDVTHDGGASMLEGHLQELLAMGNLQRLERKNNQLIKRPSLLN